MTDPYGPFSEWTAKRLVPVAGALGRALFDVEITGGEHVPESGGVVFAANHLSHIDPPLVSLAARGNVRYLAVDELFGRSRMFDRLMLFFGAIPISRVRPPLGALRTALAHLEAGGRLGVFPEGRRVTAWGEDAPKRGAAWLSLRSGAPLVPIAIAGAEGTLSLTQPKPIRSAVRIWIEPPIGPGNYLDWVDPLDAMMADWQGALEQHLGPWFAR